MLALQITSIKPFMNQLFLCNSFDSFLLSEAVFVTFSTFHIDGTLKTEYFSPEELEESNLKEQPCASWKQIRPFCLNLIKGKHTPLEFKIVFRLAPSNVQKLLEISPCGFSPADINGLFLNLHYKENRLTCTTGTSLSFFTMDKTLDGIWDAMVKRLFLQKEFAYEIL